MKYSSFAVIAAACGIGLSSQAFANTYNCKAPKAGEMIQTEAASIVSAANQWPSLKEADKFCNEVESIKSEGFWVIGSEFVTADQRFNFVQSIVYLENTCQNLKGNVPPQLLESALKMAPDSVITTQDQLNKRLDVIRNSVKGIADCYWQEP